MRIFPIILFFVVLLFPVFGAVADILVLPSSIGSNPALTRIEDVKTWSPDNMYEHVNGEAELLKRYGAISLTYVSYENNGGDYLAVDIVDMGAPVNAFGFYSLYAGCDVTEYSSSGATVLSGDFTTYAILGRHFMRIDLETEGGSEKQKSLIGEFLSALSKVLSASEPLPVVIENLKKLARKPCEVGYHPEHIDYDLEAGPGYSWIGPDGETYFVKFLPSPDEAEVYAVTLRNKGVPTVLVWSNAVTWPKESKEDVAGYLEEVIKKVVE